MLSSTLRGIVLPGLGTVGLLSACVLTWRMLRKLNLEPSHPDTTCTCHDIAPTSHWGRLIGPATKVQEDLWSVYFETMLPLLDPKGSWQDVRDELVVLRKARRGMVPLERKRIQVLLKLCDYQVISAANPCCGFRLELLPACKCCMPHTSEPLARLAGQSTASRRVKEKSVIPYGPFPLDFWACASFISEQLRVALNMRLGFQ